MPLLLLGGALAALSLGVLPLPLAPRLALAVVLALLQCGWARRQRWSFSQLLAALVLGQAMVPLPASLRDAFRAAGLSHALAASGFHLSVLLVRCCC